MTVEFPGRRVEVRDLVVEFEHEGYPVRPLDGLSFDVEPGEIVVLLGPSGSGKTTLLSCLGGMLSPTSGSIRVGDVDVTRLDDRATTRYRRSSVGFVFQAFNLIASLTARENVAVPLMLTGWTRRRAFDRADEVLERVALSDRATHRPASLSGGQQQRVAIARALGPRPALLLADEPTASLDHIQAEGIVGLLLELRDEGRAIVVSSHDARLTPIADRVVRMVEDTAGVAGLIGMRTYEAGHSIFEQGDAADVIYVIQDGEVDIVRVFADGREELLTRLGPGQYFGELGCLLGFPRSASARCHTTTTLIAHEPAGFRDRVHGAGRRRRGAEHTDVAPPRR